MKKSNKQTRVIENKRNHKWEAHCSNPIYWRGPYQSQYFPQLTLSTLYFLIMAICKIVILHLWQLQICLLISMNFPFVKRLVRKATRSSLTTNEQHDLMGVCCFHFNEPQQWHNNLENHFLYQQTSNIYTQGEACHWVDKCRHFQQKLSESVNNVNTQNPHFYFHNITPYRAITQLTLCSESINDAEVPSTTVLE